MNGQLDAIIKSELQAFQGNIRQQTRKEWAMAVRKLFKAMKLTGISIKTPSYSMASTIEITLPALIVDNAKHLKLHDEIYLRGGETLDCPDCKERWMARQAIEKIILSAYPDLNDRGIMQEDYFDYCFSIQ